MKEGFIVDEPPRETRCEIQYLLNALQQIDAIHPV